MPESVQDRCTKSHEYIFLLTKSAHYSFDCESIQEVSEGGFRNKRSVWTVPIRPYKEAHFATFPPQLIEPCIKAGSPEGGNVLDPFGGAGTTGLVADRLGRSATLIELNPEYIDIINDRIREDAGMFSKVTVDHETRAWSTSGSTTLQ
jgi:site-specific DNA-methyltransferase (cytosine-N4-specific)